ncbi:Echinoidin [Holothuria leucospilota]|uniref:Echinoidin n=1 Tax=Holothuria leucospilota TaxID=206669 RepID=A0A9Q1BXM4_HOLLE|nr:Echinoidin [Holothuria leucospilota]
MFPANKLSIILLCLPIMATADFLIAEDACPKQWTAWGDHCYRLDPCFNATWRDSEAHCQSFLSVDDPDTHGITTGHLVSIHSKEEQEFVYQLFVDSTPNLPRVRWDPRIYVGFMLGETANDLSWSDGTAADYQNWYLGQPDGLPNALGQISDGPGNPQDPGIRGRWCDQNIAEQHIKRLSMCKMRQSGLKLYFRKDT